jgi:hyperosmotically inducible periplasmic protein
MKMIRFRAALLSSLLACSLAVVSCKSNVADEDIRSGVTQKLNDEAGSGVTASVSDGVVTLSGTCKDDECRKECESEAKEVKGVKSVVNNISVASVPDNTSAPVEISADGPLQEAVNNVVKSYNDVKAEVKDGVVTLRGEIRRDKLQELMMALNALKPKKVENQLSVQN